MNGEMENIKQEMVVAYFKVLSQYSPEGSSENLSHILAEIRTGLLVSTSQSVTP
jgi:hypothetical protein